nr:glutamate-cysteine ligase family protein [uncultured Pseudomonas sp.]
MKHSNPHDDIHGDVTEAGCAEYFKNFIKPRSVSLIGLEYELMLIDNVSDSNVAYFGKRGIAALLTLMTLDGYAPELAGGLIIGLSKGYSRISLEPGGQIEFASTAQSNIAAIQLELDSFLHSLGRACLQLSISWKAIGYRPLATSSVISTIPHPRYLHLMPGLGHCKGSEAQQKMTASMQVSVDYHSASHAGQLLRLGFLIQPYIVAVCANSHSAHDGGASTKSRRIKTWNLFDQRRCDAAHYLLEGKALSNTFCDYANWALDKKLLLLQRKGRFLSIPDMTFRNYLKQGIGTHSAQWHDWVMHLGTLYPYARLKNVVEFRAADSCPPQFAIALAALWKGIAYSQSAIEASLELAGQPTACELRRLYDEAATIGLSGRDIRRNTFATGICKLLAIAELGLSHSEHKLLQPLQKSAITGRYPADTN